MKKVIRCLVLGMIVAVLPFVVATGGFGYEQTLEWRPSTGVVDGYNVEQSTNGANGPFYRIGGTIGATSTNYTVLNCGTNVVYCYRVNGYNVAGTSDWSNVACAPTPWPATITTQPTNLTVYVGQTATFTVGVTGKPPFTYQWAKSGSIIANATNASLIISSVQSTNAGGYTVSVANVDGATTSGTATLTVVGVPGTAPVLIRIITR